MDHPSVIRPEAYAEWRAEKMGKSTLFESPRLLVGLNAFEPGQSHALHAHAGMDKLYHVLYGEGVFLLEGRELAMRAGDLLVAPDGVPHGVKNTGAGRLLVMAVLARGASAPRVLTASNQPTIGVREVRFAAFPAAHDGPPQDFYWTELSSDSR